MQVSLFGFLHSGFTEWTDDQERYRVTKRGDGGYRVYTVGSHHTANYDTASQVLEQLGDDLTGIARKVPGLIQTCAYCQAQQSIEMTSMGPAAQEEKKARFARLHADETHARQPGMNPTCEPTYEVQTQVIYTDGKFSSPGVIYLRLWGGPNAKWLYGVWLENHYQVWPGIITMADSLEPAKGGDHHQSSERSGSSPSL